MHARLTYVLAVVALEVIFAADEPRATGFVPPPNAPVVRKLATPSRRTLLRASSSTSIPSSWDSRDNGWISPVKDQGSVGCCWTFASYATLETQLLKAGLREYDFSEKNIANLNGLESGGDDGGNYDMAAAYLLRWGGAVAETNDVYVSSLSAWTSSPVLSPALHVQHVVWIPALDGSESAANDLKTAIMEYGAVATSIGWYKGSKYSVSNMYYLAVVKDSNHAITVVGWDDDVPGSAFATTAPTNGAWLIKNSWGKSEGKDGYFWVSYSDVTFGRAMGGTIFIPASDEEDYDVVRGYDRLGCVYELLSSRDWYEWFGYGYELQSSVFTSAWNEELAAVGIYSSVYPNPYEISIYTNVTKGAATPTEGGVLACTVYGTLTHAGFTTIPLTEVLALADTNSFAVVYRQTADTWHSTLVCGEYSGYATPSNAVGYCYLGFVEDGTNFWYDAYEEGTNFYGPSFAVCMKAYTRITKSSAAADMPSESDDGTTMLSELSAGSWPWLLETGETFGAYAGLLGANGRSLWTSWLVGLDWTSPEDVEFKASIEMVDGKPVVTYSPSLSTRSYKMYGRSSMDSSDEWVEVDPSDPGASGAKFFKVTVAQ